MEKFEVYLEKSKETKNKVGFLIDTFKETHSNIPPSDLINLNGRIAGLYKTCKGDTEAILKAIWCSCSIEIYGSHLDYITKSALGSIKKKPRSMISLKGHAGMETD
jgi:hypothetical protein